MNRRERVRIEVKPTGAALGAEISGVDLAKIGDVLQIIRIRVNRGSRNLEEGAYEAAIVELDLAIRLADLGGFGAFRALALTNRGESRLRLGLSKLAVLLEGLM